MISRCHAGKEPYTAYRQLSREFAHRLERRFLQPKNENHRIDKPSRMVFDEIKAQLIEQMNLVVAMSIWSRRRRLNHTDGRSENRAVFRRLHRRLKKVTVEQ